MLVAADALYLRLVYQRLAALIAAGVTPRQRRAGRDVRCRVTVALRDEGWLQRDIADAAGVDRSSVTKWQRRGSELGWVGISIPTPTYIAPVPRVLPPQPLTPRPTGLRVQEVASLTGMSQGLIRKWIRTGQLAAQRPSGQPHGRWFIRPDALEAAGLNGSLLTVREVAERFDVSETTVLRWIERGALPSVRVGETGWIWVRERDARPLVSRIRQSVSFGR